MHLETYEESGLKAIFWIWAVGVVLFLILLPAFMLVVFARTEAAEPGIAVAVFVGLLVGGILGLILMIRRVRAPKSCVILDEDARMARLVRPGRPPEGTPFDELGPVRVFARIERPTAPGTHGQRTTWYHVAIDGVDTYSVFMTASQGKAREKGEEIARLLGCPMQTDRGEAREAAELDTPLYERAEQAQDPGTGLGDVVADAPFRVEALGNDLFVQGLRRRLGGLILGSLVLIGALVAVAVAWSEYGLVSRVRATGLAAGASDGVFIIGMLVGLAGLAAFLLGLWSFMRIPGIRLSSSHLEYRGQKIPVHEVEEVTADSRGHVRVTSDDRTVVVPAGFHGRTRGDDLVRVLRELVIRRAADRHKG